LFCAANGYVRGSKVLIFGGGSQVWTPPEKPLLSLSRLPKGAMAQRQGWYRALVSLFAFFLKEKNIKF
jgi:hypothetical protein